MGRDLHYVPGGFYRVDDRTGFPTRADRTKMQWNNIIVDEKVWEPRQPQDLVRGVPDYQAVGYARPISPATFVGPQYYEISEAADILSYVVFLSTLAGISPGDPVGVVLNLDQGDIFRTTINSVFATFVILNDWLPYAVAADNLLVDYAPGTGAPQLQPLLDSNNFPLIDSDGHLMFPG